MRALESEPEPGTEGTASYGHRWSGSHDAVEMEGALGGVGSNTDSEKRYKF